MCAEFCQHCFKYHITYKNVIQLLLYHTSEYSKTDTAQKSLRPPWDLEDLNFRVGELVPRSDSPRPNVHFGLIHNVWCVHFVRRSKRDLSRFRHPDRYENLLGSSASKNQIINNVLFVHFVRRFLHYTDDIWRKSWRRSVNWNKWKHWKKKGIEKSYQR